MKKILALTFLSLCLTTAAVHAQGNKSKRPSPPARVSEINNKGTTITIDYSQPSLKGRTIGTDVEPMPGQVWRMGANEATVFEVDKDVTIDGKKLPAGKYSLFGISNSPKVFTLIFNTAWNIWGTNYDQNKDKDALRITVEPQRAPAFQEKLTYTIDKEGKVSMEWGSMAIVFYVQ